MTGRVMLDSKTWGKYALSRCAAIGALFLLSACSMVPDAINPVEWYKGASDMITGSDRPEAAEAKSPKGEFPDVNTVPQHTADTAKNLPKGLVADRSNAKYAEPVTRQVSPTKALARRTPAPGTQTDPQVSSVSPQAVVPPKPAVQSSALPNQVAQASQAPAGQDRVSPPGQQQPTARGELGPDAPPASVNMNPPPAANVPETVPMPGQQRRMRPLDRQYEKRLAESAQASIYPGMVEMPQPVASAGYAPSGAYGEEAPIHLIPPSSSRGGKAVRGGGKGLAAPAPTPLPAASFQVAALDFSGGTAKLTKADRSAVAEVARLYRQTGGIVRVIGYAPAPVFSGVDAVGQMMDGLEASNDRAVAVAKELSRRGVPASKIMIAADPSVAGMQHGGAQVFLDVM